MQLCLPCALIMQEGGMILCSNSCFIIDSDEHSHNACILQACCFSGRKNVLAGRWAG